MDDTYWGPFVQTADVNTCRWSIKLPPQSHSVSEGPSYPRAAMWGNSSGAVGSFPSELDSPTMVLRWSFSSNSFENSKHSATKLLFLCFVIYDRIKIGLTLFGFAGKCLGIYQGC